MNASLPLLTYLLLAPLLLRWLRPPAGVLAVVLGGWLLLPVGQFPAEAASSSFPYWIIGTALPSDMLMTKAWVAPAAAVLGLMLFQRPALTRLRPGRVDVPILVWCGWPLLQALFVDAPRPGAALASLYLAGTWGLSWLLGRACFASAADRVTLLKGLALAGLACLPFALIEGPFGPHIYEAIYEPHPFRLDGPVRYLGYRPIGLFEHGNQYGLWVALCALAALWLAASLPGRRWRAIAAIDLGVALAAQSVGAVLLLALGILFLTACRWWRPRAMLATAAAALVVAGATYVSGVLPIERIGRDTAFGRHVVDNLRAVGRDSFAWRIAQDQRLLPAATARPLTGSGAWDWWRAQQRRPWSFTILALGQFGLIGLAACLMTWLAPAVVAGSGVPAGPGWASSGAPLVLAALIVLSVLDALLNSFVFYPSLLAAGALAVRSEGAVTR